MIELTEGTEKDAKEELDNEVGKVHEEISKQK